MLLLRRSSLLLGRTKPVFLGIRGTVVSATQARRAYHVPTEAPPPSEYTSSLPIALVEGLFTHLHTTVHLPWWVAIATGAVVLRTGLILPLAIYQQKTLAALSVVNYVQASWAASIGNTLKRQGKRSGWSPIEYQKQFKRAYMKKQYELFAEYGTNPLKPFLLPMLQLPVFVIASVGLRRLCGLPDILSGSVVGSGMEAASPYVGTVAEGLRTGGAGWFTDLTVADPTMALPIAVGLVQLMNVEYSSMNQGVETRVQGTVKNLGRVFCGGMVIAGSMLPSSLCIYWLASASYGLGQNVFFSRPEVRKYFGFKPLSRPVVEEVSRRSP